MTKAISERRRPDNGTAITESSESGARARFQVAAIGLGALMAALPQTLVVPVLPRLAVELHTTVGTAQWLLTSTLLVAAVSVPIIGRLADMYGRRLLLLCSLATLAAGSLLDALTSNLALMIVGRALSGVASAAIPLGISLLTTVLPRERTGSAVALISAMLGIGSALGLPLAGLIADSVNYHVLFWIIAAGAVISAIVIVTVVPEPPTNARGRLDWSGIVLLCAGVMALMLPLSQGGRWGWGSVATIGMFVLAVVLLVALVTVERRVGNPLVDLARLSRRPIVLTNLSSLLIGFALFSSFVGTSSYVQAPSSTGYGFGSSILVAGLCLLPMGVLMLLLAPVAARSIARWGAHRTLAVAAVVIMLGLVFRIVFTGSLWEIIVGTSIIGAGSGVSYSSLPSLINANTPRDELASANGINSLARYLGSSLSSAIGGSLLAAITVTVGGVTFPSLTGYRVLFAICAAAAVLVVVAAMSIPTKRNSS